MNINNTSSTTSYGSASIAPGVVDRSSEAALAGKKNTDAVATNVPAQPASSGDRVSISQEAQDKLNAETTQGAAPITQSGDAAPLDPPSDAKKFTYGVLGLERPTTESKGPPDDSYSYGRWASAVVTTAAILSAFI
jgi:hypothetical protein